ncbi:MAG: sigma-70 family RNA polymerase sigma factor [Rufibacter sp.]
MLKTHTLTSCAPDSDIISKVLAGDKDYFEVLIRRHNGVLYKLGRSYGFSHQDAQDLMQEAHIAAYQNLPSFETRSTYKTWLVRIMLNKCYQLAQRMAQKRVLSFSEADSSDKIPVDEMLPLSDARQEILNRELGYVLEQCIEQLSPGYRTVFVLRELEGMSVQETAAAANLTEVNVKVRLNRAKVMLRKQLEHWYPHAAVYEFNLVYCDQVVENVFRKI